MKPNQKLPVVYMDESGNKESDRYFVCGFLCVNDSEQLISILARVRDQIEAKARYNKLQRIERVKQSEDLNQLYNFAKAPNDFELKFNYISNENIKFFKILLMILIHKVDFRFDALIIGRNDPSYNHTNLSDMYKIITHMYFNYRCKQECVFVPDSFDHLWNWQSLLNNQQIRSIIPSSSHALLPLQVVDILTGIIAQGLRTSEEYSNRDMVRAPLIKLFEEETKFKIVPSHTRSNPKYISTWTIDFSRTKKGAQSMDKKPNFGPQQVNNNTQLQ